MRLSMNVVIVLGVSVLSVVSPEICSSDNFTTDAKTAKLFGVHEIEITSHAVSTRNVNPYDIVCAIKFNSPSGHRVAVKAFYDGADVWKGRLYVTEVGEWQWTSSSTATELDGQRGNFNAIKSDLRGKLHKDDTDVKQWKTDNGKWFLNLSDTAYRLFNREISFAQFKQYVEDDVSLGFTSVRVASLGGAGWDKDAVVPKSENQDFSNWPWHESDKTRYDLEKFKTTDERLQYLLNAHPDLYVQVILFGLIEWATHRQGEMWDAIPEPIKTNTIDYMLARWAAFPQVFWLIVNDHDLRPEFPKNRSFCRDVGQYLTKHDIWHNLVSCGPIREQQYPFVSNEDLQWSTYIHLENNYDVSASKAEKYVAIPAHVFNAEDRYEQDYVDRDPLNPRYYYRTLFWSWLLAGGSANYAGRWPYIHPYSQTDVQPAIIQGFKYNKQLVGADSIKYINWFFTEYDISLNGWGNCDDIVRTRRNESTILSKLAILFGEDSRRAKCLRDASNAEILLYHPNAKEGSEEKHTSAGEGANYDGRYIDVDTKHTAELWIDLRGIDGSFDVVWMRAEDGEIRNGKPIASNQETHMISPWPGSDVVVLLKRPIS